MTILSMIDPKALAEADSGYFSTTGMPLSPHSATPGSMGTFPRNCTLRASAALWPPPDLKMSVTSPQWGQTNPLMFSTIPMMGMLVSAPNLRDFLLSSRATS